MATWLTHLRVADVLIDRLDVNAENFIAGNIAPDCGLPDGRGYYSYIPDKTVSHFSDTFDSPIQYDRFWQEHGANESDPERLSFFLGYYSHLVTDVYWLETVYAEEKVNFSELYNRDVIAFRYAVRADWHGLDLLFLRCSQAFRSWKIFCGLKGFENSFLPFFKQNSFAVRFKDIIDYYNCPAEDSREFIYLTQQRLDRFVESAASLVLDKIKALNLSPDPVRRY